MNNNNQHSDHTRRDTYNRTGMLMFFFSMAFIVSFFLYLSFMHKGVDLGQNEVDPRAETGGKEKAVFDMASVKEPWVSTPEIVEYGQKFFKTNCSICHGPEGKGDGPSAGGMNPKPRNLVEGKWTKGNGVTDHFKVIANGIPGGSMAAFGHFKATDRWALVHFIESITQNKSQESAAAVAEFAKTAK